jgi:D-glycero-D-manno-heptose 1,7-bisphosphate phosphatase
MIYKLIILDRDGVINQDRPDSVKSWEEFQLIDGVPEAIAKLNEAGLKVVIVTNQAVVGRKELSHQGLQDIHSRLLSILKTQGATIDEIYVCTDTEFDNSMRRKPMPGMLLEAMADFNATPQETIMIGDDLRDLQAAANAGCLKILVKTGKGVHVLNTGIPEEVGKYEVCDDLQSAVFEILGE